MKKHTIEAGQTLEEAIIIGNEPQVDDELVEKICKLLTEKAIANIINSETD